MVSDSNHNFDHDINNPRPFKESQVELIKHPALLDVSGKLVARHVLSERTVNITVLPNENTYQKNLENMAGQVQQTLHPDGLTSEDLVAKVLNNRPPSDDETATGGAPSFLKRAFRYDEAEKIRISQNDAARQDNDLATFRNCLSDAKRALSPGPK